MSGTSNKNQIVTSPPKKPRLDSASNSIHDNKSSSRSQMSNHQHNSKATVKSKGQSQKSSPSVAKVRQNPENRTSPQNGGPSTSNSPSAAAATVASDAETCCICLEDLTSATSEALPCTHTFHKQCLAEVRKRASKCPVCNAYFTAARGTQPDGRMTISTDPRKLPGHEEDSTGTLVIIYSFHDGIQKVIKCDST